MPSVNLRLSGASQALSVCLFMACDGSVSFPGDVVAETADLTIYRDESSILCGGMATVWQAHVDAITSRFGGPQSAEKVGVVVTNETSRYCSGQPAGCAKIRTTPFVAIGNTWSMTHELAHTASMPLFQADQGPFWQEGFAEAFSERPTHLLREDLVDYIEADEPEYVRYEAAAHFFKWILAVYGEEVAGAVMRDSDDRDSDRKRFAALEEHLGEGFEALQLAFWAEAPLYAPGLGRCHETPAAGAVSLADRLDFDVVLDCASDAQGPFPYPAHGGPQGGRPFVTRRINVTEAGSYLVTPSGGEVVLLPCDPVEGAVEAGFWRSYEAQLRDNGTTLLDRRFELRPGRYQVWVIGRTDESLAVHVTVHPFFALTRHAGID